MFSHFEGSIYDKVPNASYSLKEVYEEISGDKLEDRTEKLRALPESDFKKQKLLFPNITVSGVFAGSTADSLVAYSGFVQLDFDKVDDARGLKDVLSLNQHVALCFISPSGKGVKSIVPVDSDGTLHNQAFDQLSEFFFDLLNGVGKLDENVKSIGKRMLLCHDPDAYINEEAQPFRVKRKHAENPKKKIEKLEGIDATLKNAYLERLITYVEDHNIDLTPTWRHWTRLAYALAKELSQSEAEGAFHRLAAQSSKYNYEENQKLIEGAVRTNQGKSGLGFVFSTAFACGVPKSFIYSVDAEVYSRYRTLLDLRKSSAEQLKCEPFFLCTDDELFEIAEKASPPTTNKNYKSDSFNKWVSEIREQKKSCYIYDFKKSVPAKNLILKKEDEWLQNVIPEIPHGVIDKQVTGIGATTMELDATRNSILVFPTMSLARDKMEAHYCYVGSQRERVNTFKLGSEIYEPQSEYWVTPHKEIVSYIHNSQIKVKKFLVVADSLGRLLNAIGLEKAYNDYFFFYDEIDRYQDDAGYRPKMEDALDYLKDPRAKGCVISATYKRLGDPYFLNLPFYSIRKEGQEKPLLTIKELGVAEYPAYLHGLLKSNRGTKVVVAYKSLAGILKIAKALSKEIQRDTAILCSDSNASDDQVKPFFGELVRGRLDKRLTFLTSTYFSGIDIKDKAHLVIITDQTKPHTVLNSMEIRQVAGRIRKGYISATLIANVSKEGAKPIAYQSFLLESARFKKAISKMVKSFSNDITKPSYYPTFVDNALHTAKLNGVRLLRKNIFGELVPRFLEFDSQSYLRREYKAMYESGQLEQYLSKYFTIEYRDHGIGTSELREKRWHDMLRMSTDDLHAVSAKERSDALKVVVLRSLLDNENDVLLVLKETSSLQYHQKKFFLKMVELYVGSATKDNSQTLMGVKLKEKISLNTTYRNSELEEMTASHFESWNRFEPEYKIKALDIISVAFKLRATTMRSTEGKKERAYKILALKPYNGPLLSPKHTRIDLDTYLKHWYHYLGVTAL